MYVDNCVIKYNFVTLDTKKTVSQSYQPKCKSKTNLIKTMTMKLCVEIR